MRIFRHYKERLHNLRKPHDIARLLNEEKIEVAVEQVTNRKLSLEMNEITTLLLTRIQIAIFDDHKILLTFAEICMNTGNEDIGNDILRDFSKFRIINEIYAYTFSFCL